METMGIREEHRARTLREIQRATLDLLELQGLESTTVAQIAARAGISERTFFRYYPSKEAAALPGERGVREAMAAAEILPGTLREVIAQLLEVCRGCFALEVAHNEFRRISRLLVAEPDLMRTIAQQERELVLLLCGKLEDQLGMAPLQALLAAEIATCTWRVSWRSFAQLEAAGTVSDPLEVFGRVAAELCAI